MQVDGSPGTIFAIKQLFRTFQFVVIILSTSSVCTAPVLDDIPVSTLTAIAGGDGALVKTSGVERTDDITTFFSKVFGQDALVLQSPKDDRRRVAAFLNPAD